MPKMMPPTSGTDSARTGLSVQPRRQPLAVLQIEKHFVQQIDGRAHAGDDQAGDHADQRRQPDQARFPRPHQGAQAPRYFESGRDSSDQGASPAETHGM